MASQRHTFSAFGPPLISSFDWNNVYHRTSSLSCLVQGVYTMERDRQKKRVGHNSLAKDWWERVGFTLDKRLIDNNDESIYGAVFKKDYNHQKNTLNSAVAPQYVFAFRGTMLKWKTFVCDLKNNIHFASEDLYRVKRFKQMIQEIQNYVETHGHTAVWIAGHSLGAGLALLAGKNMAMKNLPMEAYIFNPPSSMIPLEKIVKHHEKLKFGIRIVRDIFKVGVTVTMALVNNERFQEDHSSLAFWRPHLFVNQSDPICSEYVGYFQYKNKMAELGIGWIESLAAEFSVRSMFFGGRDISSSNYSPQHLHFFPSAFVMVNKTASPDFKTDFKTALKTLFKTHHGIQQWWKPTLQDNSVFDPFDS